VSLQGSLGAYLTERACATVFVSFLTNISELAADREFLDLAAEFIPSILLGSKISAQSMAN
jgi:hypothetical protein